MGAIERRMNGHVPALLAIEPVESTRKGLDASLCGGGHAKAICVATVEEALQLMSDGINGLAAIIVPFTLPDAGVHRFLEGLNILAPKPRPPVLISGADLGPDELLALAEADATSLIGAPPVLAEIVRELVSLRQSGNSPGRARLHNGLGSLSQGEVQEHTQDPDWRNRMVRLASTSRSKSAEFRRNRLMAMLARMDEIVGGRMNLAYAEALLLMARNDARQAEAVIRADGLVRDTLDQLFSLVEERMVFPGGMPAPRSVVLNALEELVETARQQRRGDAWTANYADLRAGATDLILNRLELGSSTGLGYRDRFCAWLGLDPEFLLRVDDDQMRRIAGRVVKDPDEENARDFARLSLLAHLLKLKRDSAGRDGMDATDVRALSGLLGQSVDAAERLRSRAAEWAGDASVGHDDLPLFSEFSSLFSVIEGAAPSAGFDATSLDSLRAVVATVAGVPVPGPGRSLPVRTPLPQPAAASVKTASPALPPAAVGRLLPRLAADLGLSDHFFAHHDEQAIVGSLYRGPLLDVQLAPAPTARLRVLARLMADEGPEKRAMVQSAILSSYSRQPEALDALLQILTRVAKPEVVASLRTAMGLLARRSPAREVLQILQADDPILSWLALRDLPDEESETLAVLGAARAQIVEALPANPHFRAMADALDRRIARVTAQAA